MADDYLSRIGNLIRDARKHRGWTQQQLADVLSTSQSAVNRIERGHQNVSLDMLARIGEALDEPLVSIGGGPMHLRVSGPTTLSGSIDVKTSKNAGVALLCASLLNRGRTTLRRVARIDDPEPAPDDFGRGQRRAVAEREVRPEVEDDGASAVAEVPRRGERWPSLEPGVDRRQALEQLRGDRGAGDIALGRRVERVRRAEEDPDPIVSRAGDSRGGRVQ